MDVWPMNLFDRRRMTEGHFDTSSLFQLQLACILHMVPVWKDLELRVFLLESPQSEEETAERAAKLRRQLKQLRIKAKVVVAQTPEGTDLSDSLQLNRLLLQNSTNTAVVFLYLPLPGLGQAAAMTPDEYLSALSTVSDSLPPVLYVHGISPVTSTNL